MADERRLSLRPAMDSPPWRAACRCLQRLREAGFESWVVGGAVRDRLLGLSVHDIDCCTAAGPDCVARLFPGALEVGRRFGVMVVRMGDQQLEVASFRSDLAYVDGRRPVGVRPATVREDVERRDFTINALLYDPEVGTVLDLVGGYDDLQQRLLRCIGDADQRLREDRLRVLRAYRFAAHYQLAIDPATAAALARCGCRGLSGERILQEWCRGLAHPQGWRWWNQVSVSPQRPELCPEAPVVEALAWSDAIAADPVLASVCVMADCATDLWESWVAGLPWSRGQRRRLVAVQAVVARRARAGRCQRLRDLHGPWAGEAAVVIEGLARAGDDDSRSWLRDWVVEKERIITPLLSARDLMDAGIPAGPVIGRLLDGLRDQQLLGALGDRDCAWHWVRAYRASDQGKR